MKDLIKQYAYEVVHETDIDANSIPTNPAPMIIACFGSSSMSKKSVLS